MSQEHVRQVPRQVPRDFAERGNIRPSTGVYVILDERSHSTHPLGDAVETFLCREDAEGFIAQVRGDDSVCASSWAETARYEKLLVR